MPRTTSSSRVPIDISRILDAGPDIGRETGYLCTSCYGWAPFPDCGFVRLDVEWKRGRPYTSYREIDDAVDEEGDIGHEFAHPRRIRSLIDGPLQDVIFSDAFEKVVKFLAVGDETGLV